MADFGEAVAGSGLQLHQGLQAMARNSRKVRAHTTRHLLGSADIDMDLAGERSNEPRWDYAIGYRRASGQHVYYAEVHPADTSNVAEVLSKHRWLQGWLATVPLGDMPSASFHWLASGRVRISKGTPQYRKLASSGIHGPHSRLEIR